MAIHDEIDSPRLLRGQLQWFIRLRWAAGAVTIAGGLLDAYVLGWYRTPMRFVLVGLAVLAYNAALFAVLRRPDGDERDGHRRRRAALAGLAWLQIALDLGCLTLIVLWTGGARTPFLGFYVFHMVFSSLLLPRRLGYGSAALAMSMLAVGLGLGGRLPDDRIGWLILAGWAVTLLFAVYLTDEITQALRQQRGQLVRQNRHIARMSARLREQHEAMVQHEKMAALGQMAAGVAHEIANPLASMESLLEVIERHPERSLEARLATLRDLCRRTQRIVHQMTTFAHPYEPQGRPREVEEVIDRALALVRFDERLKRLRVEKQLEPASEGLVVESHAMEQVLVNLLVNALDALEGTEEPRLLIRAARDGGWGVVEVSDNGPGVLPEHRPRLFEPFFTTKPVGKGTGLGLATSYSLLERLGGRIDVRSRPGEGATFIVRWPAAPAGSHPRESGRA